MISRENHRFLKNLNREQFSKNYTTIIRKPITREHTKRNVPYTDSLQIVLDLIMKI